MMQLLWILKSKTKLLYTQYNHMLSLKSFPFSGSMEGWCLAMGTMVVKSIIGIVQK